MRKKKKRKVQRMNAGTNEHHLCWQRRKWKGEYAYKLRTYPYCIVTMPQSLHRKIHEKMREVPVPSETSAKFALDHLEYLKCYGGIRPDDPIEKRLSILAALFDCSNQPTADAFRKQLNIIRK